MSLAELTISDARRKLQRRAISSVELVRACFEKIEKSNQLNAYCWTDKEFALKQACNADRRLAAGDASGMCGIPIGVKDLFCMRGVPTQAASRILKGFRPEYDSTVTRNLQDHGAVVIGKLNMDEFAMGSSTEHSAYGASVNPWKARGCTKPRTPGGSSGGSAAAVCSDLCLGATGTDTGGSIRQPASFTGIVGIKPTYGRCSRWGIVAFASSLDQAGPMTKSVRDSAIMLGAMAGHDAKDSTSANRPVEDFEASLTGDIRGKKVAVPREYRLPGMPNDIENMWDNGVAMLRDAGAKVVEVSLPHTKYALPAYYVIAPAEASSNLARYDGVRYGYRASLDSDSGITELYKRTRAEGFGAEVKRRIMIGTYVLSQGFYEAYYRRAQRVRSLIKRDFEVVFEQGVDFLLTPASPSAAFPLGAISDSDPIKMYLNDVFTVTVNLAGLPGVSVPVQLDAEGLPLGLQLIGRPWDEASLLNCAYVLERQAGFSVKPQVWWLER